MQFSHVTGSNLVPYNLIIYILKNNYVINIQIGHDLPIKQCYSFYSQNSLIYLELEGEGKQANKKKNL